MKGNDLQNHAVQEKILMGNDEYTLVFCFETLATAEALYEEVFNRDGNIFRIIEDLTQNSTTAVQVLTYAAMSVLNKNVSFENVLGYMVEESGRLLFHHIVVDSLSDMFLTDNDYIDDGEVISEFPWVPYYKAALQMGLNDADFWGSTPKKLSLLMQNAEDNERKRQLTHTYI